MRTRSTLLLIGAALLALAVVACGSSSGNSLTATLTIQAGTVEVQAAPGASFTPATDGQVLQEGAVVRTGSDGRASLSWFDGSETRLDTDTTLKIESLKSVPFGGTTIEAEQTTGATYHRVISLTETGSRFAVDTPTASAAVQGTTYAVVLQPDGSTSVIVTDSAVTVTTSSGETVVVEAGSMVTIDPAGGIEGPVPIPPEILNGDWIRFNEDCDQGDCSVEIGPGAVASIAIAPEDSTINLGESETYVSEGFDDQGTSLGQVQADYDIDGVGCDGSTCTPTESGDFTVTATFGDFSASANLTVLATGDIQVTLDWSDQVDLDLWVTDPNGDTVGYFNPTVASGGRLDRDAYAVCNFSSPPPENTVWDTTGPSGEYTVTIDVYDMCGEDSVAFTLTVSIGGQVVLSVEDVLTESGEQHIETFSKP